MRRVLLIAPLVTAALPAGKLDASSADTRSLKLYHLHTHEKVEIVYKRNGRYDRAGLRKVNLLLRDWRRNQPTEMNPQLLDLLWAVYRETGATGYISVVGGFRSPETNTMLRSRSKASGVAERSQHMLGNAVDFFIPGVSLRKLREAGARMQLGGIGYYPRSGSPLIHLDVGKAPNVAPNEPPGTPGAFPSGRTVYLPSDGKPLPGCETALKARQPVQPGPVAEIKTARNLLAGFFADRDEDEAGDDLNDQAFMATAPQSSTTSATDIPPHKNTPPGMASMEDSAQAQPRFCPLF